MSDIETIACPYCAEQVQTAAKKCRHCGEMIDPTMREIAALRASAQQPQQIFMNAAVASGAPGHARPVKSKGSAVLFALLLGNIGVHKFYLGRSGAGILYILFCWTFIPGVIALFEGIGYALMNEDSFHIKYG